MMTNNIKNIPELIEKITPLNNKYRDLVDKSNGGREPLETMWDVGSYLEEYINSTGNKPHKIYWEIYGKSEGIKHSYITRDFLSYCLRIKKYFTRREEIKKNYPNLKLYSLFREAFPLLENVKFQLPDHDKRDLIGLLNSNLSPKEIKKKIVTIKKERIGISNTRKQKLYEMKPATDSFVKFYNNVYSLLKNNDNKEIKDIRQLFSIGYLNDISQLISALTQEDLFVPKVEINKGMPDYWEDFVSKANDLFKSDIETRNRFRRLVAPKKIMQLSEMVIALSDDKNLANYRKKNKFV